MKTTRHPPAAEDVRQTAVPRSAERTSDVRGSRWVLCAPALAVASSFVLAAAGADADWFAAAWLLAAIWAIAASFVQALRQGLRHGDWSAFRCGELPRNDDDFDFSTGTGAYAYIRIQRQHEALVRESDHSIESGGIDLVP